MPQKILQLLRDGSEGKVPDTPKEGIPSSIAWRTSLSAAIRIATEAARKKAQTLGYEPVVLTTELQGEAREAARWLYRQVLESQSCLASGRKKICLLAGGETTVTVRGKGLGGRNTEMALAFAMAIEGPRGSRFSRRAPTGPTAPPMPQAPLPTGRRSRKPGPSVSTRSPFSTTTTPTASSKKRAASSKRGPRERT